VINDIEVMLNGMKHLVVVVILSSLGRAGIVVAGKHYKLYNQ